LDNNLEKSVKMLFADFRRAVEKTYMFEPCVVGCVGTPEHLLRVVEENDLADTFFDEEGIVALDASDKIIVLATEYSKTICAMMQRDFPDIEIVLLSESEAVVEYPGAVVDSMCKVLLRSPPREIQEICDAMSPYQEPHKETHESAEKMTMILPNLYISNEYFPSKKEELLSRNIRRIVNVTESCPNYFPEDFQYLRVPVKDRVGSDIKQHFREAAAFIEEGLKEGAVLVHCSAGISRSPTIVASYLMIKYGVTSTHALKVLTIRRDVVDVNFGFACTLMTFEKEIK
jgi:hypothetical protein